MNDLERKIFHKLAQKHWHTCERLLATIQLTRLNRVTEEQFDRYRTVLGLNKLSSKLKNPSERQLRKLESFNQSKKRIPTKQLKIAILMSGEPRSADHCLPSILRFFHGHNLTFFCHSWSGKPIPDMLNSMDQVNATESPSPDFSSFERLALKTYGVNVFGDGTKVPIVSPNLFPMWYGIQQVMNFASSTTVLDSYDLVCRMRYDNFWIGQFDCEDYPFSETEIMIDRNYNGYGGYGDQFAIGKPSAMKEYCRLYDWLTGKFLSVKQAGRCFPEVILKNYLASKKIEVQEEDFGLRLLRPEFIGLPPDMIPLRSHKASSERNASMARYIAEKYPDLI